MLTSDVRSFLEQHHRGVITTFRANRAAQMSIVACGPFRDGSAFTTTEGRAKLRNLRRDPRCSLLVSRENWWGFIVLEGRAVLMDRENTDHEALRLALREVFRAASGKEHPDWAEYDEAMVQERRVIVLVQPEHVYGWRP